MAKEDDDAWRAIVDNYGDRPEIDEPAAALPETDSSEFVVDPQVEDDRTWDEPDTDWDTDRFVPPPPPPLPSTTLDRQAAWAGVLGSPVVLLACLLLRIDVPELLAYALVGAFVGGFVYLVVKMTREPRDPDDDGAVL
ncbi:hypothetical protein [Nocardioides plantarum]|uniref:Uncharacterized protein n=1 Tax=Nocardioides plantarum TaxID=29299 RepID=A0ABV5KE49_9ACTN|nr:hypothetical protein [Nocardioides plantarum]